MSPYILCMCNFLANTSINNLRPIPSFCQRKKQIFQGKCSCRIIYSIRITIFACFFLFKWIIFKSIVWHIRKVFFIFHPVSNYKKCHKFCIMKTNPIKFRSSHEKNIKGSPFRKLAMSY